MILFNSNDPNYSNGSNDSNDLIDANFLVDSVYFIYIFFGSEVPGGSAFFFRAWQQNINF